MISFEIDSPYIRNLKYYCDNYNEGSDNFTIRLNRETIKIPVQLAVSLSANVSQSLCADGTLRELVIKMQFRNKDNAKRIASVLNNFGVESNVITLNDEEDIMDFAEFGQAIGNEDFVTPAREMVSVPIELNTKTVITSISRKSFISNVLRGNNVPNDDDEINFIAENFDEMCREEAFLAWSGKQENATRVERIIKSDKITLQMEDDLLNYVINVCKRNSEFEFLFESVFIEYCSKEAIQNFMHYLESKQLFASYESQCILKCIGRRLLLDPSELQPIQEQVELEKEAMIYDTIGMEDPLNGIFRRESEKENVSVHASSYFDRTNEDSGENNVLGLIKAKDNYSFYTKDQEGSYICFSLRDGRSFKLAGYMLRGNWNGESNQLRSWKLEGKKPMSTDWVELDSHSNEALTRYGVRTFEITNDDEYQSIRLVQTGKNMSNQNILAISGFDIFGKLQK